MMRLDTPTPVLVTDTPANASLAVVRSLGRRGVPVGLCAFADDLPGIPSVVSRWFHDGGLPALAGWEVWNVHARLARCGLQTPAGFTDTTRRRLT